MSEFQWSGREPRHGRQSREGSGRAQRALPRYNAASFQITTKAIGVTLLSCPFLFVFFRGGETLRLFPTNHSLPDVISTVIVPHRPQCSPACHALATPSSRN